MVVTNYVANCIRERPYSVTGKNASLQRSKLSILAPLSTGFITGWAPASWPAVSGQLCPPDLTNLEESFCYKEVQFKQFCLPARTSCPGAEKGNETQLRVV